MKQNSTRRFPRTLRLNELMRHILADELERIDDERLNLVTITEVEVEADLHTAVVWFDALDTEHDEEIVEAFGQIRHHLQKAIARRSTAKRTPILSFRPDVALRTGERIDHVLRVEEPVLTGRSPEHLAYLAEVEAAEAAAREQEAAEAARSADDALSTLRGEPPIDRS